MVHVYYFRQDPAVQDIIDNGAKAVHHVLDHYTQDLQHFYEQITSLNYLKGDIKQFFSDLEHSKCRYPCTCMFSLAQYFSVQK